MYIYWLVVYIPPWKICSSVGMMKFPIFKNKKCSRPPTREKVGIPNNNTTFRKKRNSRQNIIRWFVSSRHWPLEIIGATKNEGVFHVANLSHRHPWIHIQYPEVQISLYIYISEVSDKNNILRQSLTLDIGTGWYWHRINSSIFCEKARVWKPPSTGQWIHYPTWLFACVMWCGNSIYPLVI